MDYWIDLCAREAESDGHHSNEERVAALTLMTDIWLEFTAFVMEQESRSHSILYMLKRVCREPTINL